MEIQSHRDELILIVEQEKQVLNEVKLKHIYNDNTTTDEQTMANI